MAYQITYKEANGRTFTKRYSSELEASRDKHKKTATNATDVIAEGRA